MFPKWLCATLFALADYLASPGKTLLILVRNEIIEKGIKCIVFRLPTSALKMLRCLETLMREVSNCAGQ